MRTKRSISLVYHCRQSTLLYIIETDETGKRVEEMLTSMIPPELLQLWSQLHIEIMTPMAALRLSAEYQVLSSFPDGGYTKDKPSPTRHLISRAPQNPLTSSRLALATAALRPPTKINAGAEKTSAKFKRAEKKQPKPDNPRQPEPPNGGFHHEKYGSN
jgi:hypothetical protein